MCANLLAVRSQADLYYLQCNACQWSSRELGIPDRATSNDPWPEEVNPLEEELGKVMNIMKGLSNYKRLERERKVQTTKRLSNLGILQNDRFALQNAYNLRKKFLNQRPETTETLSLLAPSADVPELDPSYFDVETNAGNTVGLTQIITYPITGTNNQFYPFKVKMISRRALRCLGCETMLYKGELSPNVVKTRLQSFAIDFLPEIRISRNVQLTPGQKSAFFLTITNNTMNTLELKLRGRGPENGSNCMDVSSFSVEITIPCKDQISESTTESNQISGDIGDLNQVSCILSVFGNKAGVRVECIPPNGIILKHTYAWFNFSFNIKGCETPAACEGEVKIDLGSTII